LTCRGKLVRTILAYALVIPLLQFCLTIGVGIVGLTMAFLLAWVPTSLRTKIAGLLGGAAGIVVAVAYGYAIFRFLLGPGSFTLGPFLASTVPLFLPIRNDYLRARQVAAARGQLLDTVARSDADTVKEMARETETAHGSTVAGEIVGLLLAAGWFLGRQGP
jgi:hypothetical protein